MIVVSHRGPYSFERNADGSFTARRGGGGVVSALAPLLAGRSDATWIAAAMNPDDGDALHSGANRTLDIDLELVELDPELHRLHYDVVSNGTLWFLFHGLFDRTRQPVFDIAFRDAWDAYVAVNTTFADAVAARASERDIVLVQDYQLALVAGMLRRLRPDLRVVHFTHTPFCGPGGMTMLPDDIAVDLCASLASVPAGFHTRRWAGEYRATTAALLDRDAAKTAPFVASLGPDADALAAQAASPETKAAADQLSDIVGDRLVVARVDRIEPSKNITRGFLAFDRLLEARPGARGRTVFVAMVYASRQTLDEYARYAEEVKEAVERINDRWATPDWTPIVLDDRDDFARSLAGLQRYDVLLVNALRDGLNLVAKEGPVVNRRDGVLCLSPEAGAYDELHPAALAVHPYDIEQAAGALDTALALPMDERATRARRLRELATSRTPTAWLADLVREAGEETNKS
jgi:trehalose 6-phosphate synthase